MLPQPARRALTLGAAIVLGATLVLGATTTSASAVSVVVRPARIIQVDNSAAQMAVTDAGTIFTGTSTLEEWAPSSVGAPVIVRSWTGVDVLGAPSYRAGSGLAWADGGTEAVEVMAPSTPSGAYVASRTISGSNTQIDNPTDVAWASDGSLWVVDDTVSGSPGYEFLRFAPGANGNVAPVQRISGNRTGFVNSGSSGVYGQPFIAALPAHGLAASAAGAWPSVSIFSGSQTGNVAPVHTARLVAPAPGFLSEGITADAAGRIYLSAGDPSSNQYGVLTVFSATGSTLLTLGGVQQGFALPLVPAVSPNGTLAVVDAAILPIPGSPAYQARVEVYRPLFTKPSAVRSLKVKASKTSQTVTWVAPAAPGVTPVSYRVVVSKGARTLVSRSLTARRLLLGRGKLPKGTLRVTVTATNLGGSGPAAARTFKN